MNEADLPADENSFPLLFEGSVRPKGFALPRDAGGHLLKASLNEDVVNEV
jgi:hypothetical protein